MHARLRAITCVHFSKYADVSSAVTDYGLLVGSIVVFA